MNQLVHFSPSKITFEFTPGRQTTSHLHLRNVSEYRVAYKVKTTHIKRYCVRPNAAIIEPGTEINVELTQQAFKAIPDDVSHCRDRFLLQVTRIDLVPSGDAGGEIRGYESIADLWTAVPEQVTHEVKFDVVLYPTSVTGEQVLDRESQDIPKPVVTLSPPTRVDHECSDMQSVPTTSTPSKSERPLLIPEAASETNQPLESVARVPEKEREIHIPPSPVKSDAAIPSSLPISTSREYMITPRASESRSPKGVSAESSQEIDYKSVEYARERALGIRSAPKITVQFEDEATRQRIAVERAGELLPRIKDRQKEIDVVNRELSEARHRLSDARMATRPAYDVKYEVSDSCRVPYAQIAIMAIISGALLQLLV